jgi:hypothetical protein
MVEIKQVDILVYPFYSGGEAFSEESGERKFKQWIKNMETAERHGRAFVVIHFGPPKQRKMTPKVRKFYVRFITECRRLQKKGLLVRKMYPTIQTSFALDVVRKLSKTGFSKEIDLRYYGAHAGACVPYIGGTLATNMLAPLKTGGITVKANRECTGLSLKIRGDYEHRLTKFQSGPREMTEFLDAVKKRKTSILALRKIAKVNSSPKRQRK